MAKIIKEIEDINKEECKKELIISTNEKLEELFYNYETILDFSNITSIFAVEKLVDKITSLKIEKVILAHYNYLYKELIEKLKIKNNKIKIEYIWFGAHCLLSNSDVQYYLNQMLDLYNMDLINKIIFTNKSMYEYYKKQGYEVEKFEYAKINLDITKEENKNKKKIIGLYFTKDTWETNLYNQLSACSMIENSVVKIYPDTKATRDFCKLMKIKVVNDSEIDISKREDRLKDMSKNDVNIAVSFTDIETIRILESFALGVPCITGNNNDLKLEDKFLVKAEDNVDEIVKKIKDVLNK